ncbi:type-F conjugative transfer system protein TraW [Piscinibacter gummiphilus]|jgi:conjugal transfer pilus assembly protein TraW|uniref:Type-F conjugative transfer system protein TraW n=1 Tax=Piscinibacter gummiphilus TaxID=946333 RepID=A0ABZ0D6Y4_9BURK|nr:type-F conjugative transfer system protein TraW [Piscinibacter gummiphilus]WOB11130.1 type-F conjugative transfer system protein TraW [Piscinibacter gummiphilus]
MRPSSTIVVCSLLLAFTLTSTAKDLGSLGPTYPIAEKNLLDEIMSNLRRMEASGELKKRQEAATAKAKDYVFNPKPLAGLSKATQSRTFYYDPTLVLDRNITDHNGTILFPAGTRKNPLEVVTMSKHLLFFDARDAKQVAKAQELTALYQGKVKPILVGGSYMDLMKTWGRPVYFDQQGSLVKKLGITRVPALVSQEGRRLRIDELVLQ